MDEAKAKLAEITAQLRDLNMAKLRLHTEAVETLAAVTDAAGMSDEDYEAFIEAVGFEAMEDEYDAVYEIDVRLASA